MDQSANILKDKSLVIILAYAPTGLGHLRVTHALYHGLPHGTSPLLLGSQDKWIGSMYNVMSIHPFLLGAMEWMQHGAPEKIFSRLWRYLLRNNTKNLYRQLETILSQRLHVPKVVLVASTHFGLAHQLAALKSQLEKEHDVKMIIAVQVTDDSPQDLWYTPNADILFVPSFHTKQQLLRYGKKETLAPIDIRVGAYPLSPILSTKLTEEKFHDRLAQLNPANENPIEICIPVSGAAVGMQFSKNLIQTLHRISDRYHMHVVSKITSYTTPYLTTFGSQPYITLHASTHEREVVDVYEHMYQSHVISLEVTKPSEQSFKALLTPKHVGGSLLLFAQPVGRQEYDNLAFMSRHNLIPPLGIQKKLWQLSHVAAPDEEEIQGIRDQAYAWRGIVLPNNPDNAAHFIHFLVKHRIASRMLSYVYPLKRSIEDKQEVHADGVSFFWEQAAERVAQIMHE